MSFPPGSLPFRVHRCPLKLKDARQTEAGGLSPTGTQGQDSQQQHQILTGHCTSGPFLGREARTETAPHAPAPEVPGAHALKKQNTPPQVTAVTCRAPSAGRADASRFGDLASSQSSKKAHYHPPSWVLPVKYQKRKSKHTHKDSNPLVLHHSPKL